MATFNRSAPTNLLGSPGVPASIAAGGSSTSQPIDVGTAESCHLTAVVSIGSVAPTTSPTVQWQYSYDGATWFNDGGPFVVPIGSVSTSYAYAYQGYPQARYAQAVIRNGTGNPITAFVQGVALGVG